MDPSFVVELQSSKSLREIPGDWTMEDYRQLLTLTEYGDTSGLAPAELEEMAKMSLADLPKDEAALLLLDYVFPAGTLTRGQRQNSAHEMDTEVLWEEYPEPDKHRQFFRVGSLLYAAYNGGFPKPEARRLEISVVPQSPAGKELLKAPEPAFLLRLLAGGMDGHALLHRLYEDELTGRSFPAATAIIWDANAVPQENGYLITIISTDYWLEAFQPRGAYEGKAWKDDPVTEED